MKDLKFLNSPQSYNPDDAFVVRLSGINSVDELFEQLSEKLLFPDYFGFNWDALCDLLCDLHWIEQHKIILIHDDFVLDKKDLHIYLEILLYAIKSWEDWEEGKTHSFEVILPESGKN